MKSTQNGGEFAAKSRNLSDTSLRTKNLRLKFLIGLVLFSAILFFSGGVSFAATYYVSINGNDSNPGTTVEQPWRTIAKAVLIVSAGDTVNIIGNSEESPTVYNERLNLTGADSGLPGSWITFRAQPARSVVILQVRTAGCEYVRVEGFKITCDSTSYLEKSGIRLGSDNVEIVNNHIYDFRHYPAIHTVASSDNITIKDNLIERCNIGMWTGGNNWLVEDNEIRRLIRSEFGNDADYVRVFGSNHVYRGNYFYGTLYSEIGSSHTDGFQSFHLDGGSQSARDILIEDNLIMDCHQGIMVRDTEAEFRNKNNISPVYSLFITNWTVRNNVFAHLWSMGVGIGSIDGVKVIGNSIYDVPGGRFLSFYVANDAIVLNNIGANAPSGAKADVLGLNSNVGNSIDDYNLYYHYSVLQATGSNDILDQDPKFANAANNDFHLEIDSPAIDSGADISVYGITSDIEATLRPQGAGYDMGAYEYGFSSSNNPPTADAGGARSFTVDDSNSILGVTLDGSASIDPDGTIVSYIWTEDGNQIATGINPTIFLSEGIYSIMLTVTDDGGLTDTDSATITVEIQDHSPASILSVVACEDAVEVLFNEELDRSSAENIGNYAIDNNVSIDSVLLDSKLSRATLSTSLHDANTIYTLTVTGIRDIAGNSMPETVTSYQYAPDMIGYWQFDDVNGVTAHDSSGNGGTGILVNGPVWDTGKVNGALRFDGVDDAVEIPTTNWDVNKGTVALWANIENLSGVQYLFGHTIDSWSNRMQLYTNNGSLCLGFGDSHLLITDIENLTLQSWYHIALTWDGTECVVYINGVEKARSAYTGLAALNTFVDIGNDGNVSYRNESFNGVIDDVRLYSCSLSEREVSGLFNETYLAFFPIGDKEINEGSKLTFLVRPTKPGIVIDINAYDLPTEPNFVNNIFDWTATYDDAGIYHVTFTALNGENEDFETITVTVHNINREPVLAEIGDSSIPEGETLLFAITAIDPDGDTVAYSAQNLPAGAIFSDDTFIWTPTAGQVGSYPVTFIADDGQLQDSETINIVVTSPPPPANYNPVGYWKLDDGGGTIAQDSSGNNSSGILVNGPVWTAGKINGALRFDGVDDAVEIPTTNLTVNSGTISLWAYAENLSGSRYFFGHTIGSWSNRLQFYAQDGQLCLGLGSSHSTAINIENLVLQTWYHLALTWDGTNYVVYVNGIEKASGTYTGLTVLNTFADIGNDGCISYRDESLNGIIDEVRLYNMVLTAEQVGELSNISPADNQPPVLNAIEDKTVEANNLLTFTVNGTDPDGDAVTYSAQNLPVGAIFSDDTFTWTPTVDQAGSYPVTFIADDGRLQDSETINIVVTSPPPPANYGPVGYWKFDDGSGNIAQDSSGNNDAGILVNGPVWTAGKINGALRFDGVDDAVEVPTTNLNVNSGTISLWAYAENLSGSRYFFGHTIGSWSNRIQLYAKNNRLCLGLGSSHSTAVNIQGLILRSWYHLALTWDGTNYVVYVNGIEKARGTYTGLTELSTFADIGNDGCIRYRDEAFNGIIDEVLVYDQVLAEDKIHQLYIVGH